MNIICKRLSFFVFLIISVSNSQTAIVTIDRDNIIGPTLTGNDASISSIGLTRGSGISLRSGTDFSSDNWTSNTQSEAESNNQYIEWSVTAGVSNIIEIQGVDLSLRRNNNGPSQWQLFYSLNGFTTSGIAVNTPVSIASNTNVITNITALDIDSGVNGTITFRLYGWNANNSGGWLRVLGQSDWADYGIVDPGIRLLGTITPIGSNSNESNIISSGFDPDDNIDYTLYSVASNLTTTNALKIGELIIQDGGDDLSDVDLLPTILTDIGFDVTNFENIAALALFDDTSNVSEVTNVTQNIQFSSINSGLGLSAPDDSTYTFDIYATFNSDVTDNHQIALQVNSATSDPVAGSTFLDADAGGAGTSTAGDDNRIEVVATKLEFVQNASDVSQFVSMIPAPTVEATDSNNNRDLDFVGTVEMSSTAVFDPSANLTFDAIQGLSSFNNLIFSDQGSGFTLTASDADNVLTLSNSNAFNIIAPKLIIAVQDFDGSGPEWSYLNDISFFDNGWGVDGYYGLIAVDAANPLDYPTFEGNILGENDLNDEGGGTSGFATTTFSPVNISCHQDVILSFDWDIQGYNGNNDDADYQVYYDGVPQGIVILLDGRNGVENDEGTVSINIPNNVNEVSLEVRVRNNGQNGFSGFDNFTLSRDFNGITFSNNAWSPNAPSSTTGTLDALLLNGTYTIDDDVELNNVYMQNNSVINIEPSRSLIVNGCLESNGNVNMRSTGTQYSSLIVDGTVLGDANYSRHVNNTASSGENDLISAPVTGQPFDEFRGNNPNILSNSTNTLFLFGPFDKTSASYILYSDTSTAPLLAGEGYRAASTDDGNFNFNGVVNTGNIDVNVEVSGPSFVEWNLIGNPYPSYLSLSAFLGANASQFDPDNYGVYGYDGDASDGWVIWNQAYSDANPNAIIAPGQGFFIAANGDGTISFTPAMRSIGSDDDFIPGFSQEDISITHLKLNLNSNSNSYNTDFYFTDNASLGLDPGYDSGDFGGSSPSFAVYSHLVQDNAGIDMVIQSVSHTDLDNTVVIPLGVNAAQGQQLTFSIKESTLLPDVNVFLEDTVENTTTLLNDSDYVFTPSSNLNGTGRFNVRFEKETLSDSYYDLNEIKIYYTNGPETLIVRGELIEDSKLKIIDIQGRVVKSYILSNDSSISRINLSGLSSGIYIVQVENTIFSKTQKIAVK